MIAKYSHYRSTERFRPPRRIHDIQETRVLGIIDSTSYRFNRRFGDEKSAEVSNGEEFVIRHIVNMSKGAMREVKCLDPLAGPDLW